jgi:membrane protease YdiL (CAAX protease family)
MTVTKKAIVFLAITFAISWTALIGGWLKGQALMSIGNKSGSDVGTLMILGPLVGAVVCTMAFERGRRIEALGLRFKPNWWWIGAALVPIVPAALSVALTLLLSDRIFVGIVAGGKAIARAWQAQGLDARGAGLLLVGLFVQLTLTEELGWRGYLHHLWRPFGFWRTSLATGLVWGAWHLPAVVLFGLGYPGHPVLGAFLYPLWTMLLAPLFTVLRERGRSIWAPGICHAVIDGGIAGLAVTTLSNPTFPWNGLVGIGGFIALALLNLAIFLLRLDRPSVALAQDRRLPQ